jgi:hypothetical protein
MPSPAATRPQVAGPQLATPPGPVTKSNPITPQLMRQFNRSLNLSADQKEKIQPIVSRAGEDFQRLREENLADVTRVNERMYADVSAVLTMEQRVELQAMRQRFEDRIQAERQKRAEAAAADAANRANKKAADRAAGKQGQGSENPK